MKPIKHKLKLPGMSALIQVLDMVEAGANPNLIVLMTSKVFDGLVIKIKKQFVEHRPEYTITMTIEQACAFNIVMPAYVKRIGVYEENIVTSIILHNFSHLINDINDHPNANQRLGSH